MLTALFIGLGSIGTRHLNNLAVLCAQRGLDLRADALRSDLSRPLRPGAAERLTAQFTSLSDPAALPRYDLAFITNPGAPGRCSSKSRSFPPNRPALTSPRCSTPAGKPMSPRRCAGAA